ncbi:MAG: hypothetical protein QNJ77_04280 [Acidimicrobiia bacterium]|nr:hypothetical protein [Acidimicrobiia bacterium]
MLKHGSSIARFVFWTGLLGVALVATLRIGYGEFRVPDVVVQMSFVSPSEDGTTLMTSSTQDWAGGAVTAMPTLIGINVATFEVPTNAGEVVRWDPGVEPGEYTVTAINFVAGEEDHHVDLASGVASPENRDGRQSLTINPDGSITLTSVDPDPQLLVSVPDDAVAAESGLLVVLTILGIVGAVAIAAAVWKADRWNETGFAIGFVAWLYAVFVFYVFKFASRLPFWDDWRYLREVDETGQIPISLEIVLKPFNDTVAATGRTIDTIVLNATGFNFLALQLVGVALFGVYVALVVILVRAIARNIAPGTTPYAILLVAFALPAMSYWLEPAIAYHQFLPLLFGVGILLTLRGRTRPVLRSAGVVTMGLLAGFSYISGAVMLVAMAIAYALTFWRRPFDVADAKRHAPGVALVAVALFTIASQLYLINRFQGSLAASSSVAASKYPWEPEFWAFYLGVAGRAVGLRSGPVLAHALIVAGLVLAPLVGLLLVRSRRGADSADVDGFALLFASILVPLYVAAVSFGRAGMLGDLPFGELVAAGGARFHYWWVAALVPLVWLTWVAFLRDRADRSERQLALILLVVMTIAIAVPKSFAPWHFPSGFANRDLAFDRTITCLTSNIMQGSEVIACRHASSGDIGPQVRTAYRFDMVFIDQAGLPETFTSSATS